MPIRNEEYIVWGVAPNTVHEQPLYTKSKTLAEARHMMEILAQKPYHATKLRVQVLDMLTPPDFSNIVR